MRSKPGLACTGEQLPAVTHIQVTEPPQKLDDFCQILNPDDEILLYEQLSSTNTKAGQYYWAILQADDYPLGVCTLEQYANWSASQGAWSGRRSDYLAIGSAQGHCYLVVIELRHVLVTESQEDDKFEQLKETITTLIRDHLPKIQGSTLQAAVYTPPPPAYKIIGAVIAPGKTRQSGRNHLNPLVTLESQPVILRTLPKDALQDCQITWTELLRQLGVNFV